MEIRKPTRATRTFTQKLVAPLDRVFPLLCPVLEGEWIEGWDPLVVYSDSGVAERDCVFMMKAAPHPAIWFVTRHEPERGFVEMLKISPEVTACRLSIQLTSTGDGCEAKVTYSHTSLGPLGDDFVAGFTEEFYDGFMRDWETRMNHYLKTGAALRTTA